MFQEIMDKIWFIQGNNNGRYPYSNSIFINDKKKLLIDTGISRIVIKKLLKQFGQPDLIIYSHGHEDHIYDTDLFTSQRFIHEKDKQMALSREELYRVYGINTLALRQMLDAFLKSLNYRPLTAVNTFTNNQIFDLGTIQLKVLHSPGHSAGHCCFEILEKQLIFSADIDLTSFGPFYGALDSDIHDFEQSIKMVTTKSPKILVTSHKGIISEGILEKLEIYNKRINERTGKILNFLEKERSLEEIIPHALIYGKFAQPQEFYMAAERIMLEKHLEILLTEHKIDYHQGKYKRI